jgi:hypothetical protein
MNRNAVVLLLGCLYVAGSAWLVVGEGETYRETLRRDRLPAPRAEMIPPAPAGHKAPALATLTETPSTPAETEAPSEVSAAPVAPVLPAKTARSVLTPRPPRTAPPETKPSPETATPAGPATNAPAASATRPAVDPFWNQPHLKQSWDLTRLSTRDEARLGAELNDLIVQLVPRSQAGPWQRRVEEAAKPFLKNCQRKDVRYIFTVLESDAVCAFSHPGGYVYVCRGLFNLIAEDEPYALEFAVGHEIAHVDLQHALGCLRDPGVMKLPEGTLEKLFWMIIPFAYLDDPEFEADRWTYSRMRHSGRSDRETLAFLRKLKGYAEKNEFENGRVKPKANGESWPLENHYRAHTATWKRLEHLKEFIDAAANPKK